MESRAPQEKGESASEVELSLALIDNFDRTRPLLDGSFKPKGIDLLPVAAGPAELFRRVAQDAEFEVTELSTSTFMILKSRGDSRYTGLPVFPSRNFRHG